MAWSANPPRGTGGPSSPAQSTSASGASSDRCGRWTTKSASPRAPRCRDDSFEWFLASSCSSSQPSCTYSREREGQRREAAVRRRSGSSPSIAASALQASVPARSPHTPASTRTRRPPEHDWVPRRPCFGGEAAAPPPLSSSMRLGTPGVGRPHGQRANAYLSSGALSRPGVDGFGWRWAGGGPPPCARVPAVALCHPQGGPKGRARSA
jgi:hypothetical protein